MVKPCWSPPAACMVHLWPRAFSDRLRGLARTTTRMRAVAVAVLVGLAAPPPTTDDGVLAADDGVRPDRGVRDIMRGTGGGPLRGYISQATQKSRGRQKSARRRDTTSISKWEEMMGIKSSLDHTPLIGRVTRARKSHDPAESGTSLT